MRGAGPAGGLLFLAVLGLIGWLIATDLDGIVRIVLLAVVVVAGLALGADVIRRR